MSHLVSEIHTKAVARVTELRPVIEAADDTSYLVNGAQTWTHVSMHFS